MMPTFGITAFAYLGMIQPTPFAAIAALRQELARAGYLLFCFRASEQRLNESFLAEKSERQHRYIGGHFGRDRYPPSELCTRDFTLQEKVLGRRAENREAVDDATILL